MQEDSEIMKKEHYIYFCILFFTMQVIDLILTHYALRIDGISEANPLYFYWWFIPVKLSIPIFITVILYYIESFKKNAKMCMSINIAIYSFIILNNSYWIITYKYY